MTYPATLEFDWTDAAQAGAVIQAAREMRLPFEVDGPRIVVVVDSAMTAYRFGLVSATRLRSPTASVVRRAPR